MTNETEQGAVSETHEAPAETPNVEPTPEVIPALEPEVEPAKENEAVAPFTPPVVDDTSKSTTDDLEPEEKQLLEKEFVENSAVAHFIVDAIEGNGALEKKDEGVTLRLKPIETSETTAFFKSFPPVLHIGVVHPEVAAKFKVGGRVSLILLNED